MKMSIPYEKEIVFSTKIAEITSISLEYEASILDDEIDGEFIISGDYKIHELSVNKEPFKYRVPFSVSLTDDIIRDSIKYDINNFTYEVIDDDTLKVNIEFGLEYDTIKPSEKKEESLKDAVTYQVDAKEKEERKMKSDIEFNNLLDDIELNNQMINKKEEDNTVINDNKITDNKVNIESAKASSSPDKEVVLNNVNNALNTYVTYHIHILSDGEDINTIINKYKVNKELIDEYNANLEWVMGEKVIIPELQDE